MKKLRSTLDSKEKTLEAEEKRLKQSEELMKKEQSEWKSESEKKQAAKEADLKSKISSFADNEAEYVQKWDELKRGNETLDSERGEESKKLEQ